MVTRLSVSTVLAVALALPLAHPAVGQTPTPVVFQNVSVIPLDSERVLEARSVVVEGRRIRDIGPAGQVDIPADAQRIDARGMFLIPGLAEMHAHIPPAQAGEETIDRVLFLFVANGITTVRGMLGNPYHLQLKEQVARGERLGPQIFTSGPSLNGNSVPDAETARRLVTEQRAAGYDLLKIHPGISWEAYRALAATANSEGIPFAGHIPADVGLRRALEAGHQTVEHVDGYIEALLPAAPATSAFFGFNLIDEVDESKIAELARLTRDAGAWVTPTQVLFENRLLGDPAEVGARPEMRFVADSVVAGWVQGTRQVRERLGASSEKAQRFIELRRRLIHVLHDAGVGILLGADAPQVFNVPGFATVQELEAMVAAGLTPFEALVSGARNPAVYFGLGDSFGTIAVDKRADLVLLEANPLQDIRNVRRVAGVMVAGRWLPRAEIDRRLEDLEAR